MSNQGSSECAHSTLLTTSSPYAAIAGYTQPTAQKCLAATTSSGRVSKNADVSEPSPWTFPAPLALPGHELAFDPNYPPQSFRSWKNGRDRNQVTKERCTIYVAAPPQIDDGDAFIRDWACSPSLDEAKADGKTAQPRVEDVVKYLAAFYHPLPVRLLEATFRLTTWDAPPRKKSRVNPAAAKHIALVHGNSATQIRVRKGDVYTHQLNLDDLLDGVIESLPSDAYSLLLLMQHDLYEGDDDDFCCGRAYGGSRVAVVSSARYHPGLDLAQGLQNDREHAWPASHCEDFAIRLCAEAGEEEAASKNKRMTTPKTIAPIPQAGPPPGKSPLQAAINALLSRPLDYLSTTRIAELLYLSRLSLTSAHELGHTLGLDHCVYYACLMSGAASLAEDMRGAPYLCAVCSVKVSAAGTEAFGSTDATAALKGKAGEARVKKNSGPQVSSTQAELERCRRLRALCMEWEAGDKFRAFGAWLGGRIAELEGVLSE